MLSTWETLGVVALVALIGGGVASANVITHAQLGPLDLALLKRANTEHAEFWMAILTDPSGLNLPASTAAAVCRWFGIESSGNALTVSKSGERGLAQITHTSAIDEKALTPAEWAAMISPSTTNEEHARIAWKVIEWCYSRATKYIYGPLPTDEIDQIWYAKLYHQRPVDVRDAHLTGEARADSARLEMQWAGDATKLHYLHAANVIAWNSLSPPFPALATR
jgi:hypothetical protein